MLNNNLVFSKNYADENNDNYKYEPIINLDISYTYSKMVKDIKTLHERYPNLITYESLAETYDTRNIWLVKLGKGPVNVVIDSGLHGREYTTQLIMKMIEEYAEHYRLGINFESYNVNEILDNVTFYILPMSNPDGFTLSREGIESINNPELVKGLKKIRGKYSQWKANARGVDLNRNFICSTWGVFEGKRTEFWSSIPAGAYFPGYSAHSEIETQTIEKLLDSIDFTVAASYHSRGEKTYWYKPFESKEYNDLQKGIAYKLKQATCYQPVPSSEEKKKNGSDGTISDYIACYYHKPIVTIEVYPSNSHFPISQKLVSKAYSQIKTTALLLGKEGLRLTELNYFPYKVYQHDKLLHSFHTEVEAKLYAVKYAFSSIVKGTDVIWNSYPQPDK